MVDFEKLGVFYLGRVYDIERKTPLEDLLLYDSKDLVTHAVCIGMTGSGKTGLCISLIEEAAIDGVPAILIDPKGDVTNLLLTFPDLQPQDFLPWINVEEAFKKGVSPEEYAAKQAVLWKEGLGKWGQNGNRIQRLRGSAEFLIYTPGSSAGLQISILKSFEAPPPQIVEDEELLQERINTTVTSLLMLLGLEADPIKSREHILISNILASCWRRGENLDLGRLIQLIQAPPIKRVGVFDVESFYPAKERFELAMKLNNLLAAPGFSLWLEGDPLDVSQLLYSPSGKPRITIFYIAHLNDAQRMFFVSLLLNQIVGWMRTQSGTTSLRAILYIDEVFGYLPPVANPPSKLPLITLLKQARAFGLGVVLATQNPIDLDYKALSNAGTWFLGRLQTERDKQRVLEGLEGAAFSGQKQYSRQYFDKVLSGLGNRIFLMNNVHEDRPVVFETRWAMSYLRGPLTREQIKTLMEPVKKQRTYMAEQAIAKPTPTAQITIPAATTQTLTRTKPLLPPGIREYYMPLEKSMLERANTTYKPMLIGAAQIQYSIPKMGIYAVREKVYITPFNETPVPVNWDQAKEAGIKLSELLKEPPADLPYADLPQAALNPKNYTFWEKDFLNWLAKTEKLQLFRSPTLNETSKPGETERDFRIRLQQIAREKRDQQAEKLRQKYASAFARLEERIRRAKITLEEERAQAKTQKYQTAVSVGEIILTSFLGRKSSSRATRATREITRTMKEKRDIEKAEENLKALQEEKEKLEAQFKEELDLLETKMNPLMETLETVEYKPNKTGIQVQLIALLWVPQLQN
ncbi:MAG: ATP-binding protein [Candidatus Bathyarchaeia archaeon]